MLPVIVMSVRLLVAMMTLTMVSGQQADDRCLLDSGGSTQRFFVSEDLPVGSVLGKLSVKGEKQFGKYSQSFDKIIIPPYLYYRNIILID